VCVCVSVYVCECVCIGMWSHDSSSRPPPPPPTGPPSTLRRIVVEHNYRRRWRPRKYWYRCLSHLPVRRRRRKIPSGRGVRPRLRKSRLLRLTHVDHPTLLLLQRPSAKTPTPVENNCTAYPGRRTWPCTRSIFNATISPRRDVIVSAL